MNIPITLISYALTHKTVNQLRLYLYFKAVCSGHFKVEDRSIRNACEFLNWKSEKTFHKNLHWLLTNKWLTYNSKSKVARIVSFSRLCHKLDISTKTGVLFEKSDFETFRPFLYAAIYAWSIKRKIWLERQPERNEGRSRKSMSKPKQQMPNRYLAKILHLDHSTISRYKKAASNSGYITVVPQYEKTQFPSNFLCLLKAGIPEEAHLFSAQKGFVQRQLPDIITTTIHLKRFHPRPP